MTVRDQHGAAATGICDDRCHIVAKRGKISPGQSARTLKIAGMRVQCATTNLISRTLNSESIGLEHSRCRAIHVRKKTFADATTKQQYGSEPAAGLLWVGGFSGT